MFKYKEKFIFISGILILLCGLIISPEPKFWLLIALSGAMMIGALMVVWSGIRLVRE